MVGDTVAWVREHWVAETLAACAKPCLLNQAKPTNQLTTTITTPTYVRAMARDMRV